MEIIVENSSFYSQEPDPIANFLCNIPKLGTFFANLSKISNWVIFSKIDLISYNKTSNMRGWILSKLFILTILMINKYKTQI
jgi:hypothetical protein